MPSRSASLLKNSREDLLDIIARLIGQTVTATCNRCLDTNLAFKETQRSRKGFVSTLEVLETILMPMLDFGDRFFPKSVTKRQELEKTVQDTLLCLINTANSSFSEQKPLLPGDPYVNTTGDRMRKGSVGFPYVEANAFFVSTILHYLLTRGISSMFLMT